MQQMMKSGETSSYSEAEQKLDSKIEKELSPEIVEKVMEKVQDILRDGVAYSSVEALPADLDVNNKITPDRYHRLKGYWDKYTNPYFETIRSVMRYGLLGANISERKQEKRLLGEERIKKWASEVKRRGKFVHFNILGRIAEQPPVAERKAIPLTRSINHPEENFFEFAVIFDISSYAEGESVAGFNDKVVTQRKTMHPVKAYFPGGELPREFDKQGRLVPYLDYGFITRDRISPRQFRGVILNTHLNIKEMNTILEKDVLRELVPRFIGNMTEAQKNPTLLVPIYDEQGNLLWPRKMSHIEVGELLAEREKQQNGVNNKHGSE